MAHTLNATHETQTVVTATGYVTQFFDEQAGGSQYGTSGLASTCSRRDYKDATDLVVTATGPVTHALTRSQKGATEDGTGRGTPIVPAIAFHPTQDPISSVEVTHAVAMAIPLQDGRDLDKKQNGLGVGSIGDPAYTLDTLGQQAVATVTGTLSSRTTAAGGLGTDFEVAGGLQVVGFDPTGSTADARLDLAPTLRGSGVAGNAGHHAGVVHPQSILAPTLTAANDPSRSPQSSEVTQQVAAVLAAQPTMAVRRLLPVETERLQGFPDGWTDIPWKNKPAPDGPRYKAMGNSMAVPVMRWIGERLDRVAKGEA